MKTLYFDTYHTDLVGGGGLALHNLAVALQNFYEVNLAEPWNDGMRRYEFLRTPARPFKVGRPDRVDITVSSKYNDFVPPLRSGVNVAYCLYPRHKWDMSGYDKVLTVSEYSKKAIKENWGVEAGILIGGAFREDWTCRPKKNIFLNSARFFMEGDVEGLAGHSKNQHILIQAFRTLPKDAPWSLVLSGSIILDGDHRYLEACRKLANGDNRIKFLTNSSREELLGLYSVTDVYVHAMGHGRTDPAETEHYGIAVEKGLLAGCFTVVHDSGGAPEIAHAVWRTPDELAGLMRHATAATLDHAKMADGHKWRTWDAFVERVGKIFVF